MADGPDIGVGSAGWYAKMAKSQVMAAGVGAFLGKMFERFLDPGPTFKFTADSGLAISTKQGVTVTIDKRYVGTLWWTLHREQCRFHLGTTDDDLPDEYVEP